LSAKQTAEESSVVESLRYEIEDLQIDNTDLSAKLENAYNEAAKWKQKYQKLEKVMQGAMEDDE
jgi:hypothetical protein